MEISQIPQEQCDEILSFEESHFLDLKAVDIKPAKLSRSISALANTAGGELYVGIDEDRSSSGKTRSWRGFPDQESANQLFQVLNEMFPLEMGFSASFLGCEGQPGHLLHLLVHKSRKVVNASNGIPYIRKSAQNLPVDSAEKLERLRLDKGVTSFESNTLNFPIAMVTNSTVILEFLLNVIPSAEPETWLKKQLLIVDGKPTVVSALLFAEEPQAVLPKRCGVKIFRHETKDEEGSRETLSFQPFTVEGHIYQQVFEVVERTVSEVEKILVLGVKGLEKIKYPRETLHEIITNAVLHRDYSVASDIQVRIFDNRIEVENPGTLPGHITVSNILDEQLARNGALVRLVNKFPNPPNKDVGEGLNTAFNAMRRLRLKDPVIEESSHSVKVTIRHEPLASPEDAVMKFLENHEEISNSVSRELTGISSENRMKEVFYRLRDRGLIERVPGKKGSASTWREVGEKA